MPSSEVLEEIRVNAERLLIPNTLQDCKGMGYRGGSLEKVNGSTSVAPFSRAEPFIFPLVAEFQTVGQVLSVAALPAARYTHHRAPPLTIQFQIYRTDGQLQMKSERDSQRLISWSRDI
jgi:hypothetical protein